MLFCMVYWQNFPHSALSCLRHHSCLCLPQNICIFQHYWLLLCQHLLLEAQQLIPKSCWVFHFHIWCVALKSGPRGRALRMKVWCCRHVYIDQKLIDWRHVREIWGWGLQAEHWSCWLLLSRSKMLLTYAQLLKHEKPDEACNSWGHF